MRNRCPLFASVVLISLLGAAQETPPAASQQAPSQASPSQPSSAPPQKEGTEQKPSGQAEGPPNAPSTTKNEQEKEIEKKEQSYRVMGVVPMFGTTDRQDAPPLTPKQKFHLFAKSAFDPVIFVLIGAQAGISQAQDSFHEYGQGAEGYAKRYGAAFADSVSANFFANFFYPTLLKQDPRYFRLGEGSTKHRTFYAVKQMVVAHTDSGGRAFTFSNVLGALTAGSISNAYYPDSDRGFGLTMSRAGIALLYGTAGSIFSEFWPDIQRKLLHKNKPETPTPPATAGPNSNQK